MLGKAYTIVYVRDVERCSAFYRDILGMAVETIGNDIGQVQRGGTSILLAPRVQAQSQDVGQIHLALDVQDLEQVCRELSEKNVDFSAQPAVTLYGKQATICDPEGTPIDLIEWNTREEAVVSGKTIVNDILLRSPEAMGVLEEHGIRICGGCIVLLNGTVQETAEYSGLSPAESSELVHELDDQVNSSG